MIVVVVVVVVVVATNTLASTEQAIRAHFTPLMPPMTLPSSSPLVTGTVINTLSDDECLPKMDSSTSSRSSS